MIAWLLILLMGWSPSSALGATHLPRRNRFAQASPSFVCPVTVVGLPEDVIPARGSPDTRASSAKIPRLLSSYSRSFLLKQTTRVLQSPNGGIRANRRSAQPRSRMGNGTENATGNGPAQTHADAKTANANTNPSGNETRPPNRARLVPKTDFRNRL